ncbi:MAG: hypothetical protein K6G56_01845 [Clostridiales bacterium]|nr:hypothetical protein [Clostridiales bacterium]
MSVVKKILAALLAVLILGTVAVRLPLPNRRTEPDENPPPASISVLYREAESILICSCARSKADENGVFTSRFKVETVLAGNEPSGSVIVLREEAVPGALYLAYLRDADEGKELIPGALFAIEDNAITAEDRVCTIDSIIKDIERQQKILAVPAQSFFYERFDELVNACDEIVIGRVIKSVGPKETLCRSTLRGESTIGTIDQVFLRVKIENGLYSGMKYGDKIDVVISPYSARPVINAVDLTPKTVEAPPETYPKEGGVYVFFLIRSEDAKSGYRFAVNPYEGYVQVIGNTIYHPYYNDAMRDVNDLRRFASKLREAMAAAEAGEQE